MMQNTPLNIVLLHGAWHGGWCWSLVADLLRARGHSVFVPTLTGLGERAHLLDQSVDFETFVQDVYQHLVFERLHNVILVGHSFGGNIAGVVADRYAHLLERLIFLDGGIPENGHSTLDQFPPDVATERLRLAQESSNGLTMPCPSLEALGLLREADQAFAAGRLTPHPLNSYLTPTMLNHPIGNGLPCNFVVCTDLAYGVMEPALSIAATAGWPMHELRTGHDG
ncbi:MAG: alpha/beta hydrolase [Chloroflexota bacterium]